MAISNSFSQWNFKNSTYFTLLRFFSLAFTDIPSQDCLSDLRTTWTFDIGEEIWQGHINLFMPKLLEYLTAVPGVISYNQVKNSPLFSALGTPNRLTITLILATINAHALKHTICVLNEIAIRIHRSATKNVEYEFQRKVALLNEDGVTAATENKCNKGHFLTTFELAQHSEQDLQKIMLLLRSQELDHYMLKKKFLFVAAQGKEIKTLHLSLLHQDFAMPFGHKKNASQINFIPTSITEVHKVKIAVCGGLTKEFLQIRNDGTRIGGEGLPHQFVCNWLALTFQATNITTAKVTTDQEDTVTAISFDVPLRVAKIHNIPSKFSGPAGNNIIIKFKTTSHKNLHHNL